MSSAEKPAPGEQDYKYANELRELIHEKVLEKVRLTDPGIDTVVDPYPVDAYFQWNWEYPGAWYLIVAIPEGFKSRNAFIDFLVGKTLERQKDSYFRVIYNRQNESRRKTKPNATKPTPGKTKTKCVRNFAHNDIA